MIEIPNFSSPNMYNDAFNTFEDAVENRREGIRAWADEMDVKHHRIGDMIRWAAGKLDATTSADIEAHLDAVKTQENSLLDAVQAIVDSTDTEEDRVVSLGLIVRPPVV
jgi:hypothetical protein